MRGSDARVPAPAIVGLLLLLFVGGASGERTPPRVLHRLPFPAGQAYKVWQGNNQGPSHNDEWNRYAFDFSPMAVGSPVCATADGVVTHVKEDSTGPTGDFRDNNEVAVLHADGTVSVYVHLEKDGALVEVGQRVFAGDVIARSGNTGKSSAPHLHFGLKADTHMGVSVPCRFEDVPGDGVPLTAHTVTSQNRAARPLQEALDRLDAFYDLAVRLEAREVAVGRLKALSGATPPADLKALLDEFEGREDLKEVYAARRDALLARYRADADAALATLAEAEGGGDLPAAVAAATWGRADYAPLEQAAKFQQALTRLRKDPGFEAAARALVRTQAWRRDLGRALEREAKAREQAARGKRPGWEPILETLAALVERSPSDAARAALAEHLETLRSAVDEG